MNNKVLIKWYDAKFCSGTHDKETILAFKMALFESLGYLIFEDDPTTFIAAEYNDEDEYRDITLIPTGSIVSIQRLTTSSFV